MNTLTKPNIPILQPELNQLLQVLPACSGATIPEINKLAAQTPNYVGNLIATK